MRRSFWILMTMVTRPLCWALAAAAVVAGIYVYSAASLGFEKISAKVLTSFRPIRSIDQLEQAVKTPPAGDIEIVWGDLALAFVDPLVPRGKNGSRRVTDEHQQIIDERLAGLVLPLEVAAIETSSWIVSQAAIDRLGEITSLQRLGFLVSSGKEQPLDLAPLANLKQLQLLDLGIVSNDSVSLLPLAELPELETISIGSHQLITTTRMAEIAQLPTLRTLYLPDVRHNARALDGLKELANSQSLERINIAIPITDSAALRKIRAINPNVKVSSSIFSWSRIHALIAAIWTALILSGLGIHIGSQFSLPMAQLAPGYQRSHQLVTWLLLLLLTVTITLAVCSYGANWLPVFSLVGLCLVIGVGESISSMYSFGDSMNVKRLGGIFTIVALGTLIYIAYSNPVAIEAYLMGEAKLLPLVFLGVTGLCVAKASRVMHRLCRQRIETGRPLMLSMHDIQRAAVETQSRKLHSTATAAESASTEPFARQTNLAAVFGYVALAVVLLSMVRSVSFNGIDLTKYVVMFSAGLAGWSLFVIGVKWWQRMPYLANLITRPPTRKLQIDGLFRNVRTDISKLWPVFIAVLLTISQAALFSPDNQIVRLIVSALIVASIAGLCYAGIIWSLTIRTIWGVAVLSVGTYFVLSLLVTGIIAIGVNTATAIPAYRFVIVAIVLGGIAIAATIKARHYFDKLEWARFA